MTKTAGEKRIAATVAATALLLAHERFVGTVYEPCRTDDGIMEAVHQHGLPVFTTSIALLGYDKRDIINIITEPGPEALYSVIVKAIDLAVRKTAMLLPLDTLAKYPFALREMPLVRVYVLSNRIPYRKAYYAWFVWEKGSIERASIHTI